MKQGKRLVFLALRRAKDRKIPRIAVSKKRAEYLERAFVREQGTNLLKLALMRGKERPVKSPSPTTGTSGTTVSYFSERAVTRSITSGSADPKQITSRKSSYCSSISDSFLTR